ncbi:MAG: GGDEF domain-containing protein [Vicinamibacteraceae bacterium]|nr:GGDEF domain-containing protein [Vicinamibacteraceae bacterium]
MLGRSDWFGAFVAEMHESVDPRRVADLALARLAGWLGLGAWAVLAHEGTGTPEVLASRGLTPVLHAAALRLAGAAFLEGETQVFAAVADVADGYEGGAGVVLPLACRGHLRAVAVGLDARPADTRPRLTDAGRRVLDQALAPMAIALDNALRIARAEALSVTDDLTQLYNSRFLALVLRRESKRSARTHEPVSLLFLDLDGFKDVNDTHGHLAGSRCLVEVATMIRASARETDVVARFGGDEFAVVLPDTNERGARAVAERVRARIADHEFLAVEGLQVRLTASVGIATLPGGMATADALLQAADRAMYRVKERGKNGIEVATHETGRRPSRRKE